MNRVGVISSSLCVWMMMYVACNGGVHCRAQFSFRPSSNPPTDRRRMDVDVPYGGGLCYGLGDEGHTVLLLLWIVVYKRSQLRLCPTVWMFLPSLGLMYVFTLANRRSSRNNRHYQWTRRCFQLLRFGSFENDGGIQN
jgi:hypothetical protein